MSTTAIIIVGIVAIYLIFCVTRICLNRIRHRNPPISPTTYPVPPTSEQIPEVGPIDLSEVKVNPKASEIYNLIILDGSGSMQFLRKAARYGFNQTLNAIREAQKTYPDDQQHFASFVVFNDVVHPVFENARIVDVRNLAVQDYIPDGNTALYDAVGMSLTNLKKRLKAKEKTLAVVTIISDGMENASREYDHKKTVALIEQIKDLGCTVNFMGPSYQMLDRQTYAQHMAQELHIDNFLAFEYTDEGFREAWGRQHDAVMRFYSRARDYEQETSEMSADERRAFYKQKAEEDKFYSL